MDTDASQYHHRLWLSDNNLDGLSYLWHIKPDLPKSSWNMDSSDHRAHVHCLFVHLRLAFVQRTGVSVQSWYVELTVLSGSGFPRYFSHSIAWRLEGHTFPTVVSIFGLYTLRFPWNFSTALCTSDVEISKKYFLGNQLRILWPSLAKIGESWPYVAWKD